MGGDQRGAEELNEKSHMDLTRRGVMHWRGHLVDREEMDGLHTSAGGGGGNGNRNLRP